MDNITSNNLKKIDSLIELHKFETALKYPFFYWALGIFLVFIIVLINHSQKIIQTKGAIFWAVVLFLMTLVLLFILVKIFEEKRKDITKMKGFYLKKEVKNV